ncbi:MAG: hypothetical protein IJP07_06535 [Firmicutes bacterium]|nr:hypothetical protein [Bacillota bacterium]
MKENERFGKWGKLNKREKRFFLILAACLCLGILLMRGHGGNAVEAQSSAASQKADSSLPPAGLSSAGEGDQLEQELEELLCQVKGAGRVHVALRYADSAAAVYAYDESTRVTTGENSSTRDTEARIVEIDDQPVLVSTTSPRIQGVVVVAEGGGDPLVKERLYQALSSLLGINAAQIAIIEAEGSRDYEN